MSLAQLEAKGRVKGMITQNVDRCATILLKIICITLVKLLIIQLSVNQNSSLALFCSCLMNHEQLE